MRIAYPVYNARPYYDRSPAQKFMNYEGIAVAPHAEIQRDLYTCPAGKRAKVMGVSLTALRVTAAAPVGLVKVTLRHTSGGITRDIQYAAMLKNNVGDSCDVHLGELVWLETADEIRLETSDLSTGGTVTYLASVSICEYQLTL